MSFKRRLLFLVPSSICWKVFYLKYDVILNKTLEYIIKAPCLGSSNVLLHTKWPKCPHYGRQIYAYQRCARRNNFYETAFYIFYSYQARFYNKIFDIFVRSYIGTINSHGFFGGWFYKFVYDMDEEFTPISPRDEKKFNNNRLVFKKDTYTCISLH